VTGDKHALSLGENEGVRIVTSAEFLKILGWCTAWAAFKLSAAAP